MSWRNQGVAGWRYFGPAEVGVLGSEIPNDGLHGAALLHNEQVSPTLYYRVEIVTPPTSGTLVVERNSAGRLENAATGSYTATYYVYETGKKLEDADNVGIATFIIGNYSTPPGIASTTYFGVPTFSISSFPQTSLPTGIDSTTYFGVPQTYMSGGLQISSPDGIDATTAFGAPTSSFSGVYWIEIGEHAITWTEIN